MGSSLCLTFVNGVKFLLDLWTNYCINAIEDESVIKKILNHLGLWDSKPGQPPKPKDAFKRTEILIDDSFSQLPPSDDYLYVDDHDFSVIDAEYPEAFSA